MIIKTPDFTINARIEGLMSIVWFTDCTYTRGKFSKLYGQMNFHSGGYPEYSSEKQIFLPGTDTTADWRKIAIPTTLLLQIEKWINGDKSNYTPTREEKTALINYKFRLVHKCYYTIDKFTPVTCKEYAVRDVMKAEGKEINVCIGSLLPTEQISQLKAYIDKLPPEANITFEIEEGLTNLKLGEWWKSPYRVGWLFVMIRIITKFSNKSYYSPYITKRLEEFLHKHTLSEQAAKHWSYQINWINLSDNQYDRAFDL